MTRAVWLVLCEQGEDTFANMSHVTLRSAIETMIANGYEPTRTVVLAFGFDEEASGFHVRSMSLTSLFKRESLCRAHKPWLSNSKKCLVRTGMQCWSTKEVWCAIQTSLSDLGCCRSLRRADGPHDLYSRSSGERLCGRSNRSHYSWGTLEPASSAYG